MIIGINDCFPNDNVHAVVTGEEGTAGRAELPLAADQPGLSQSRQLSAKEMRGSKCKAEQLAVAEATNASVENSMTAGAITKRVGVLGKQIGLHSLTLHDRRHYWATSATRGGTDI